MVVKDLKSKTIFSHVVPQKGVDADGYAVVRLVEDIKWLGYTKILLKADNERAIVKLLHDSLRRIKTDVLDMDQIAKEHPPSYDSRSNGSVESAVKAVQGLLRTLKLAFEERAGGAVPASHPMTAWLVEHVAWILITRAVGASGRTPYHVIRRRPFTRRLIEFGECCLYKLPTKGPRHDERGKLEERWRHGIFLGFARQSNEYVLWDEDKVVKSRSHQRVRREARWPSGMHEKVSADPHSTYAALLPERFGQAPEASVPVETAPPRATRSVAIRKADWEKHGSTPGCSKCSAAIEMGWGFTDGPHSPECVERFRRLFMETEEGRRRVQKADERRARQKGKKDDEVCEPKDPGDKKLEEPVCEPMEARESAHPMIDRFLAEPQEPEDGESVFARSDDEPMEKEDTDMGLLEGSQCDIEVLSIVEQLGGYWQAVRPRSQEAVEGTGIGDIQSAASHCCGENAPLA